MSTSGTRVVIGGKVLSTLPTLGDCCPGLAQRNSPLQSTGVGIIITIEWLAVARLPSASRFVEDGNPWKTTTEGADERGLTL